MQVDHCAISPAGAEQFFVAALTFYGLTYYESNKDLLERLGPHTTGKGCLYVKRLDALDREVLTELVERSWAENNTG